MFVVATANDVSKLPPAPLRRGRFNELIFVDLPTREERREIIDIDIRRSLKQPAPEALTTQLLALSDGFAGSDLESALRKVVKQACLNGAADR